MDDNFDGRTPSAGVKRPWESTKYRSDNPTSSPINSAKRLCISESARSQPSNKSEASALRESGVLPPILSSDFEYVSFTKSTSPNTRNRLRSSAIDDESSGNPSYHSSSVWSDLERVQRGYHPMAPIEIIDLNSENSDIDMAEIIHPDSETSDVDMVDHMVDDELTARKESSMESSCDSCFGAIIFENLSFRKYFFIEKKTVDVSLEVDGTITTIRVAASNEYGGILDRNASRTLSDLVKNYDVELSATMKTPSSIEILVYGRFEQGGPIGDMLLERDCFLQQPESHDTLRPYHNPQCLSDLDKESFWGVHELSPAKRAISCKEEESRVIELLNSATGPTSFRRVLISEYLISELKEHQVKALSIMMEKESGNIRESEFPSVWSEGSNAKFPHKRFYNHITRSYTSQTPKLCLGGLLADEMGLGKTLITLALVATSPGDGSPTLIICPMTTITCWQDQIERHFKKGSLTYRVYHGSSRDDNVAFLKRANIVLTTYETLRAGLLDDGGMKRRLKTYTQTSLLHSIDWYRVVLDEAHVIRNRATKTFKAVYKLEARHRWCLSGTPIQNRLEDLGALVEFLRVAPFDNPGIFQSTFLTPIHQGRQYGWERLRLLVKSIALRRTKNALKSELDLPPRCEIIQMVDLNGEERCLYDTITRSFTLAIDIGGSTMKTFQFILRLQQICNHGSDLLPPSLQARLREASTFILPQHLVCEICDSVINEDESSCVCPCFHQVCRACLRNDDTSVNSTGPNCPLCDDGLAGENKKTHVVQGRTSEGSLKDYCPSSKVKALLRNLEKDHEVAVARNQPPAKSVIFSAWTSMLDLIGKALSIKAFKYQRLDGSMNLKQRAHALDDFREDQECTILLASLGSAAVGLNLTMATRVHLIEPGWNPLLEQQAIDRVHRLGQDREVIAIRYIVSGSNSIERYIRQRQEHKLNVIASSLEESKTRHDKIQNIMRDLRSIVCTEGPKIT